MWLRQHCILTLSQLEREVYHRSLTKFISSNDSQCVLSETKPSRVDFNGKGAGLRNIAAVKETQSLHQSVCGSTRKGSTSWKSRFLTNELQSCSKRDREYSVVKLCVVSCENRLGVNEMSSCTSLMTVSSALNRVRINVFIPGLTRRESSVFIKIGN